MCAHPRLLHRCSCPGHPPTVAIAAAVLEAAVDVAAGTSRHHHCLTASVAVEVAARHVLQAVTGLAAPTCRMDSLRGKQHYRTKMATRLTDDILTL